VSRLDQVDAFTTLDGSTIRELTGPASGSAVKQSVAEAAVPPGGQTAEHFHRDTEEIYLFTAGHGRMRLGVEERDISAGDCVTIDPGVPHKLWNTGEGTLRLLCCCAPAYRDDDTVITEQEEPQGA